MRSIRGKNNNLNNRRSGYVFVEFVLVFCLFLLPFGMALIQYGEILRTTLALNNVSREVGRYAAVNGRDPIKGSDAAIRSYAATSAQAMRVKIKRPTGTNADSDIIITPESTGTRALFQNITVTITFDMSSRLFLPPNLTIAGLNIPLFSKTYTTTSVMPMF